MYDAFLMLEKEYEVAFHTLSDLKWIRLVSERSSKLPFKRIDLTKTMYPL